MAILKFIKDCYNCIKLCWKYRRLKVGMVSKHAKVAIGAQELIEYLRCQHKPRNFLWAPSSNAILDSYGEYIGIWEVIHVPDRSPSLIFMGHGPLPTFWRLAKEDKLIRVWQ